MGDRGAPTSESTDASHFQYVDLKRNAVRGPDSQRGELWEFQHETRRASWARSPPQTLPSQMEERLLRTPGERDSQTDAFKELLPEELTRRGTPERPRFMQQHGMHVIRSTTSSDGRMPMWSKSSSLGTTPVGIPKPDLNPFGTIQEAAFREQAEIWFREADTNRDGRIDGDEAVAFFSRTELPTEELSKMWRYTVPYGEHYMNKTQFSNALKIVSLLQNQERVTSDSVSYALNQPYPTPTPRIVPLERPASRNEDPPFTVDDEDCMSSSTDSAQQQRAYSLPVPPGMNFDWGSSGGDSMALQSGVRTHEISLDVAYSATLSDSGLLDEVPTKECLVSVQTRLAPLRSKEAANLRKLIGVNGSLIAAPSLKGGILQYYRIQDDPQGSIDGHKKLESEDVDSAFCSENDPSHSQVHGKVISMLIHEQSGYLFLGFNDSYIEMHHVGKEPLPLTKCVNSWKAHKHGSIDALAMTMWGTLWTGSSRGSVRIWHDIPVGRAPDNGEALKRPGGDKPHGSVKAIVVSSCGSVVWTAGQNNIFLWDAYSGAFLGRIETDRMAGDLSDNAPIHDRQYRINTAKGLDVDPEGRIATAQRFGARTMCEVEDVDMEVGGAGLKVAVGRMARIIGKGRKRIGKQLQAKNTSVMHSALEEEVILSPIQCMVALMDKTIWVGYKKGQLEQFTWNGQLKERHLFPCGLSCLCAVDDRVWVGLNDGCIAVFDLEFRLLKQWSAHEATVIDMAILGPLVYSLAADGSIIGWSREIPHAALDASSWQKFTSRMKDVTVPHKFKILCGTWNVNQARPPQQSLRKWLCHHGQLEHCDIVVLGLQEVEGSGSVAKNMAIGKYSRSNSDRGSAIANWWAHEFKSALDEDRGMLDRKWKRVALRQMSGIIIYVFSREKLMKYIGNIGTAHVGTGVMGVGSNKGGVAITFSLYRRRVTVVAAHFAAHKDNVAKRNNDYRNISQGLSFSKEKENVMSAATAPSLASASYSQGVRGSTTPKTSLTDDDRFESFKAMDADVEETEMSSGLQQAELLIWLGDFNYRLETTYEHALQHIRDNKATALLSLDQCKAQMREKRVFVGMREGRIRFNPTYKFDKGFGCIYDSSEKKRVPAWTDRIFFRGSKPFPDLEEESTAVAAVTESDGAQSAATDSQTPLICIDGQQTMSFVERAAAANATHDADDIVVTCEAYSACMNVPDSDHKPVWCLLNVNFPAFIQEKMRTAAFNILREDMSEGTAKVMLQLDKKFVEFIGDGHEAVEVQNRSDVAVKVMTFTEEAENANRYVPGWLDITPRTFFLGAGMAEKITITVSQKGISKRLHSTRLYRRLILRAEAVHSGWRQIVRDYDVGVLMRAT